MADHDKVGVTPVQMDIGLDKPKDILSEEVVSDKEIADYYSSPEFKARERRVIKKLDFYIAPLLGSFNFIVRVGGPSFLDKYTDDGCSHISIAPTSALPLPRAWWRT